MRDLTVGANFRNFELEVVACFRLGQVHHSLGRYAQAADVLRRVIAALAGDLLCERCGMAGLPSVFSRSWLALSLGERGEFADGIACGEEGLAIAERAEHPYSVIVACAGLGSLYLLYGDIGRATVVLERGLVLDRVESIPLLFPLVASPLGSAYASSGRVGEALPLLEQAVEQAASTNFLANHALRLARVGEAYLAAGLPDRASEWAERALRLSVEHRERGHEAHVRRLLGEIAAHGDPPDGAHAEARFREALALAQALDMRPLTARCYASLGALYRRLENGPKAEECLGAAADLAGALGMQPAGIRCRVPEGR
jgi:tetratricopeptide (TPR) repeat protein